MRKTVPLFIVLVGWSLGATIADAQLITGPRASQFTFQDAGGQTRSARVIGRYYPGRIAHPLARIDSRLDRRLLRAATLADERANARSKERCWRYVKQALLAAGAVSSYPKTAYAKQAGDELVRNYGFKKLSIRDPYAAPVGSVLVYSNGSSAGHVEIRTKDGFVSDYRSKTACGYRLLAAYGKFSS
jgi:hypothetical protein